MPARVVVIAKSPLPGRSKTRLCPPCTSVQAAVLAEAALRDTLGAVVATDCAERVIALDGRPGSWLPPVFEVVAQGGGGLDRRLEAAFSHHTGPTLLVGMDTPQVTPELLEHSIAALLRPGADAVLGAAEDGGYWAIGFRRRVAGAFAGVPMSRPWTGESQRRRLRSLGLRLRELPTLRDVDEIDDARAVAALHPSGEFAAALAELEPQIELEASLCAS